jgi:hypothetical protein
MGRLVRLPKIVGQIKEFFKQEITCAARLGQLEFHFAAVQTSGESW